MRDQCRHHNFYGPPIPIEMHSSTYIAVTILLFLSACTPTVYKPEVEKFAKDVDFASQSFDQLTSKHIEQDFADRNTEIAHGGSKPVLSKSCTDMELHIEGQFDCLAQWSMHRQDPSTATPACAEPKPFAPLVPKELMPCDLGTSTTSGLQANPTAGTEDSKRHRRLADALAVYANGLGSMVSSDDIEALDAATADAGAALKSLQSKLIDPDAASGSTLDLGPIASLVSTGLRLGLEARRFQKLKQITEKADPVVNEAAGRLSIYATLLYGKTVVEPSLKAAEAASFLAVPGPPESFLKPVEDVAFKKREYDSVLAADPSLVFQAVADAHHELVIALGDPARQYDALRSSVAELTEKVKALADALKPPPEEATP